MTVFYVIPVIEMQKYVFETKISLNEMQISVIEIQLTLFSLKI